MRKTFISSLLAFSIVACSQPSKFVIKNESGKAISNVTVMKGGEANYLGDIAPGELKEIEFNSYFETSYSLSYDRSGQNFAMKLCYQGMDFPANGIIIIKNDRPTIECR